MRVWRLVKKTYAQHAWDGEGARIYGGRWNLPGTPAIYTASTLSLAVLEILVGFSQQGISNDFVAFELQLKKNIALKEISAKTLPKYWQKYPAPYEIQTMGNAILQSEEPLVLSVPSSVIPIERNYLFKADFFKELVLAVSKPLLLPLDPRLFTPRS